MSSQKAPKTMNNEGDEMVVLARNRTNVLQGFCLTDQKSRVAIL